MTKNAEHVVDPQLKQDENDFSSSKSKSSGSNRPLFERIWCAEDELVILRGLIAYPNEKKSNPTRELSKFHDFITGELQFKNCTTQQVKYKIKKLKERYRKNKKRELKNGRKKLFFLSDHHENVYNLSNLIWGNAEVRRKKPKKATEGESSAAAVPQESLQERISKTCREIFGSDPEEESD